jgi:MoaA/NifB/PqqE/SkfB family radical SAM enzyme
MFTLQTKFAMLKALITKNSPFYIQFYVSKHCHLRCRMCNIVDANRDVVPLPGDKIERIAANLRKIGAGVVLLTGGEPFLRPDIDEIVRVLKSHRLDVRMQTAGLYEKREKIAQCVRYGARDINVSIDSLDEELSDFINGRAGSWRDAMRTISFVSRVFPGKDSICALGCVLSPYNLDEIEAVLDFATEIGWWLSLVPVHLTVPDKPLNFRGYDESFRFRPEDRPRVRDLVDRLKRSKRQGKMLFDSDEYLDSICRFVTTGSPDWRENDVCDTPNLYFAVLPDGRFAPCCDFRLDEDLFVYAPDFPDIYRSIPFRKKVRDIARQCPGCNFGSFPEMTLSARSLSTIYERIRLQLRAGSRRFPPLEEDELSKIVSGVKARHPIYPRPLGGGQ